MNFINYHVNKDEQWDGKDEQKISKDNQSHRKVSNRDKLPFRETTICFIIYKGKIITKVAGGGKYLKFPGGGVDKGETPKKALIRELKEELGCSVKNLT